MFGPRRGAIYLILLAGLLAVIWASYRSMSTSSSPTEKPLSELLTAVDNGQVDHATFNADGNRVDWSGAGGISYRTFYPVGFQLVDRLQAHHIRFTTLPSSSSNLFLSVILPNLILILLIGGFMWYMLRTMQRRGGARLESGGPRAPS